MTCLNAKYPVAVETKVRSILKRKLVPALVGTWVYFVSLGPSFSSPPPGDALVPNPADSRQVRPLAIQPLRLMTSPCAEGPEIRGIFDITESSMNVRFHGVDVYGIDFQILKSGQTVRKGAIKPTTNLLHLRYSPLGAGTYTLRLSGSTCEGVSTREFVVEEPASDPRTLWKAPAKPAANAEGRLILMNATAYGLDPTAPTGLHPDHKRRYEAFSNLYYNGEHFSGVDGLRLAVPWYEYEPREGEYQDAALRRVIEYTISKGHKFALCFWPILRAGDPRLPESDYATLSGGGHEAQGQTTDLWPVALYGPTGRAKLTKTLTRMAKILAEYKEHIVYTAFGYGDTEEFFLPLKRAPGTEMVADMGGYSHSELAEWERFSGGQPAPRPDLAAMPWSAGAMYKGSVGRLWFKFLSKGLYDLHRAMARPFQEQGLKICGFFADAGGIQRMWYISSADFVGIFDGCDYIYSSDGEYDASSLQKLAVTDLITSNFPKAGAIIEFDPGDLHEGMARGYGLPLPHGSERLRRIGGSFFARGGKILEFAMAFSTGEEGYYNTIEDLVPGLWYLRKEKLEQTGPLLKPVRTISRSVNSTFQDGSMYEPYWQQAGGGVSTRIDFKITDSPLWKSPR